MLVLSRKKGERLRIRDDIFVTVLSTKGDRVKLGIEAPRDVKVLRDELPSGEDQEPADADKR